MLGCSLAQIIAEDAESPWWDMFLCGSEDGKQKQSISQGRQKEPVLIQQGLCICKRAAPA